MLSWCYTVSLVAGPWASVAERAQPVGQLIGAPSVKPSVLDDVGLTLVERADAEGRATIGIVIKPLVNRLWLGGTSDGRRHAPGAGAGSVPAGPLASANRLVPSSGR